MAQIRADEITKILRQEIEHYERAGRRVRGRLVISVGDGIARIHGLEKVMAGELIEFPHGVSGIAMNLEEDQVGSVLLGDFAEIKEGDEVRRTRRIMSVPWAKRSSAAWSTRSASPSTIRGPSPPTSFMPSRRLAPGVVARQPVKEPLQTGIKAIDGMVPIGRGQRELIIGDRQTGKTAIAVDTIINQKGGDVICIYVAIGQKRSTVAQVVKTLEEHGAMEYTIVVLASASDPAPMQYLAPFSGCAMASISATTSATRCASTTIFPSTPRRIARFRFLLRRRRDARPSLADVFYLHSRLLERAAKLNDKLGGGSLTALPFIETQAGDVSAYIPTNVISITDGQIFLESDLFNSNVRPAINVGISVSRVGGNAQTKHEVDRGQPASRPGAVPGAGGLRAVRQRPRQSFIDQLNRGKHLVEILKQGQYQPLPIEKQIVIIYAGTKGYLDDIPVEQCRKFEEELYRYVDNTCPGLWEEIRAKKVLEKDLEARIAAAIKDFKAGFVAEPR